MMFMDPLRCRVLRLNLEPLYSVRLAGYDAYTKYLQMEVFL